MRRFLQACLAVILHTILDKLRSGGYGRQVSRLFEDALVPLLLMAPRPLLLLRVDPMFLGRLLKVRKGVRRVRSTVNLAELLILIDFVDELLIVYIYIVFTILLNPFLFACYFWGSACRFLSIIKRIEEQCSCCRG